MLLPAKDQLKICFAHPAYQHGRPLCRARHRHRPCRRCATPEAFAAALPEADVVVVSMMWKNDLAPQAKRLKFIQSISAGIDQYDREVLRAHGIRLANAAGVNAHAVAEHAMALILALKRHLHTRPRQPGSQAVAGHDLRDRRARGPARRQDPAGRRPGTHRLAAGAARPRPSTCASSASGAMPAAAAMAPTRSTATSSCTSSWRTADIVALTCPLTPETTNLIDAKALGAMKPIGASHQCGAREGGRRAGADPRAAGEAHRRRRPRRHAGGAAARRPRRCGPCPTC